MTNWARRIMLGVAVALLALSEGAGLYKAEGIDVEVVHFTSGAKVIASVLGGSAESVDGEHREHDTRRAERRRVATVATLYTLMPFALVLSNDAMKSAGIAKALPIDERVKRGLKIGTTGPGPAPTGSSAHCSSRAARRCRCRPWATAQR